MPEDLGGLIGLVVGGYVLGYAIYTAGGVLTEWRKGAPAWNFHLGLLILGVVIIAIVRDVIAG